MFGLPRPLPVTLAVRTEYLQATLALVKRLEISKELIRECVTVPGCCCMPLLHNPLMDSCSYVRKNTLLAAFAPPPPRSATAVSSTACKVPFFSHFRSGEMGNKIRIMYILILCDAQARQNSWCICHANLLRLQQF